MIRKSMVSIGLVLGLAVQASALAEEGTVHVPGEGETYWVAVDRKAPEYPRVAALNRVVGCVAIQFIVEEDGRSSTEKVLVSEPSGMFDESALEALREWRFEPGPDNPGTVPAVMTQTIDFELVGEKPVSCRRENPASAEGD